MSRFLACIAAAAMLAAAGWAWAAEAQTRSSNSLQALAPLQAGETRLADGGAAYLPRSRTTGPLPLIILLHGAGGYPADFLDRMKPIAERRRVALFQPRSIAATWDAISPARKGRGPPVPSDAARIEQSLRLLVSRAAIDRSHITLLGFSDGATYALYLGLQNPRLFGAIVALSPGGGPAPAAIDSGQRLFVAHGRRDRILPYRSTADALVPTLRSRGASVTFRPFAGDHEIDAKVLDEALDLVLGAPGEG